MFVEFQSSTEPGQRRLFSLQGQVSEVLCIYGEMMSILVICFYSYFEEQTRELLLALPQFDIGNEENPPLLLVLRDVLLYSV